MHLQTTSFTVSLLLAFFVSANYTLEPSPELMTFGTSPTTTNKQRVALDVGQYPVAPKGLELEQVHVYVRHGERTPVGVRMSAPPASISEHWMLCKNARRFRAAVFGKSQDESVYKDAFLGMRKVVERADGTRAEGECLLGELTDVGRESTYNYGRALRNLYIEKLGFLPNSIQDDRQVYFRSTNVPRTVESLQQIIHGLYPVPDDDTGTTRPYLIRNGKDENLIANTYTCKRLEILQLGFAQAAAAAYNHTLEPLDRKLSKYIGGNPIRVDGKPRASGILDTVRAAVAHDVKVPSEFEEKGVMDLIEKAVVSEWFAGYKTEEVRRLGMGRLLQDLSRKMQHKAERDSDPLKILVHSTHDTAIAGLCSTLDVFDEKWPAFTASVTFELFKKKVDTLPEQSYMQNVLGSLRQSQTPEHYVRVRYQNKSLQLPICADEGRHLPGLPEFCTLAAFQERIKELTPVDWDLECAPGGR